MEFKAFTQGVEQGGLKDTGSVKILICYMLSSLESLTKDELVDILGTDGLVNYFDYTVAIEELVETGHVEKRIKDDKPRFYITEKGIDTAKTLEYSIPYTVRQKTIKTALTVLAYRTNCKENNVVITQKDNGLDVLLEIGTDENKLMSINIDVPDMMSAEYIKSKFYDDPKGIYSKIIEILTN